MKRRVFTNLLLAFIIIPLLVNARDYYFIAILNDNSFFSGDFWVYFRLEWILKDLALPLFWLIFILLPYNIILPNKQKKQQLPFYKKVLLFELVLAVVWCLLGTFMNVWISPYWKNLLILLIFLPLSFIFSGFIHFFVDRKYDPKNDLR